MINSDYSFFRSYLIPSHLFHAHHSDLNYLLGKLPTESPSREDGDDIFTSSLTAKA